MANTEGQSMQMCSRSLGEYVGCTEIKTHEVELIVKKIRFGFSDEIHDDNKEIIEEDVRFYATNVRKNSWR